MRIALITAFNTSLVIFCAWCCLHTDDFIEFERLLKRWIRYKRKGLHSEIMKEKPVIFTGGEMYWIEEEKHGETY